MIVSHALLFPTGSSEGTCMNMSISAMSLSEDQFSLFIMLVFCDPMFVQFVVDPVQLKLLVSVLLSALYWK